MKHTYHLVAAFVLVIGFLCAPVASAGFGETLLGNGCYIIPTQSTLVKVLVGAREKDNVLIAQLTTGEIWVLKAFFDVEPTLTHEETDIALCVPTP